MRLFPVKLPTDEHLKGGIRIEFTPIYYFSEYVYSLIIYKLSLMEQEPAYNGARLYVPHHHNPSHYHNMCRRTGLRLTLVPVRADPGKPLITALIWL